MSLIRYNPRGLTPWFDFDIDRFFSDWPAVPAQREARAWAPAVDVFEDENRIVLKADLPDMDEKAVDIQVEDGMLTIKGERKFENETKDKNFHRVERRYGSFSRSFALPEGVDEEKISANYTKGVLEVTVPKTAKKAKNVRTVTVNS
ncbi:MAG: Hsp20/alpha crystallin family protein [Bryobacterales bacterium]